MIKKKKVKKNKIKKTNLKKKTEFEQIKKTKKKLPFLTFQEIIFKLQKFWSDNGCVIFKNSGPKSPVVDPRSQSRQRFENLKAYGRAKRSGTMPCPLQTDADIESKSIRPGARLTALSFLKRYH